MCNATTKTGFPCKASNLKGSAYCRVHQNQKIAPVPAPSSLSSSSSSSSSSLFASLPAPSRQEHDRPAVRDLSAEAEDADGRPEQATSKRQAALDGSAALRAPPAPAAALAASPVAFPSAAYYVAAKPDGSPSSTASAHRNPNCSGLNFVYAKGQGSLAMSALDVVKADGSLRAVCKKCATWTPDSASSSASGSSSASRARNPKKSAADVAAKKLARPVRSGTGHWHLFACPAAEPHLDKFTVASELQQALVLAGGDAHPVCRVCRSWAVTAGLMSAAAPKSAGIPASSASSSPSSAPASPAAPAAPSPSSAPAAPAALAGVVPPRTHTPAKMVDRMHVPKAPAAAHGDASDLIDQLAALSPDQLALVRSVLAPAAVPASP